MFRRHVFWHLFTFTWSSWQWLLWEFVGFFAAVWGPDPSVFCILSWQGCNSQDPKNIKKQHSSYQYHSDGSPATLAAHARAEGHLRGFGSESPLDMIRYVQMLKRLEHKNIQKQQKMKVVTVNSDQMNLTVNPCQRRSFGGHWRNLVPTALWSGEKKLLPPWIMINIQVAKGYAMKNCVSNTCRVSPWSDL